MRNSCASKLWKTSGSAWQPALLWWLSRRLLWTICVSSPDPFYSDPNTPAIVNSGNTMRGKMFFAGFSFCVCLWAQPWAERVPICAGGKAGEGELPNPHQRQTSIMWCNLCRPKRSLAEQQKNARHYQLVLSLKNKPLHHHMMCVMMTRQCLAVGGCGVLFSLNHRCWLPMRTEEVVSWRRLWQLVTPRFEIPYQNLRTSLPGGTHKKGHALVPDEQVGWTVLGSSWALRY